MSRIALRVLNRKHILGAALTLSLLSVGNHLAVSAAPAAADGPAAASERTQVDGAKVTPLSGKSRGVTPLAPVTKPGTESAATTPLASDSTDTKAIQTTESDTSVPTLTGASEPASEVDAPPAAEEATGTAGDAQNALALLQNEAADHYEAARVYINNWDLELAEQELKASIMCVPKTMAAHRDYCFVALLRGNVGRSVAEFMQVVGLCEPVAMDDAQKEKIKDSGLKLHYERGVKLASESKFDDALTEFEWARFYRPNVGKVTRSIAFAYASTGRFDDAEREYAQGFKIDPADAYGHADLAFLMAAKGSAERAVEQLSEAVKLQPKVAALHVDLGWMAESKGDLPRAENEFQEAVKLSPKHASLWTHLGKLQARQGKAEQAKQAYQQALAIDPDQMDAKEGLSHLNGGQG